MNLFHIHAKMEEENKSKNMVICRIVDICHYCDGKRIQIDPLLDKQVKTSPLSGR